MTALLNLELRRMLADKRFLILMLILPIAMYLLFTNVFGSGPGAEGESTYLSLMVSMAAMGAIGATLMATGPRIAQERANGWLRQLKTTPIASRQVLAAKVLSAMVWALPAIVLVDLTAVLDHAVRLSAWQWIAAGALMWLGAAPFAALGTLIGYLTDDSSAFAVLYGLLLFLSAVGGLWMPESVLPKALQHISDVLPSNRLAELGWRIAGGHAPTVTGVLILAGWLILFTTLAFAGYRRANTVR